MKSRTMILVAGMHRSGTSLVSKIIHSLGVATGTDLIPSDQWNRGGYYESIELNQAIDDYLMSQGSTWDDPRPISQSAHLKAAGRVFYIRLKSIILKQSMDKTIFMIKNPRICRIMNMCVQASRELSFEPIVVMPIRHPAYVANSLFRRDFIERDKCGLLWLRHVLDAERHTRDCKRFIIRTDDVVQNWSKAFAPFLSDDSVRAYLQQENLTIEEFVQPALLQSTGNEEMPQPRTWISRTYELVTSSSVDSSHQRRSLDEISEQFDAVCKVLPECSSIDIFGLQSHFESRSDEGQLTLSILESCSNGLARKGFKEEAAPEGNARIHMRALNRALEEAIANSCFTAAEIIAENLLEKGGSFVATTLVKKGWALLALGKPADAMRVGQAAFEVMPHHVDAHLLVSYSYGALHKRTEANHHADIADRLSQKTCYTQDLRLFISEIES